MKLLTKYFNLCDHDTSTSQTDELPWQYCTMRSIVQS